MLDKITKSQQTTIALYGIGIIVILILIYFLSDKIIEFFRNPSGGLQQGTGGEDSTIDIDESELSFDKEQYNIFADRIYEAFNYTGSDWAAVLEVFQQMRNDTDVKQLINAYGVRTLYIFGLPSASLNLPQTLQREDSWSWDGVEDVNEILENNSITLRF
jgi:hypothetical protein